MTISRSTEPVTRFVADGFSRWPLDDSVPLVDHTVGGLLELRARERGDAPALVGTSHGSGELRRYTYIELHTEASRVARALLGAVRPGEYVAIWAPNVVEWPIVQYGAALAGVTLVALNPVLRAHELTYALNHSGAAALIHAERSRDYHLAAVVGSVQSDCPGLRTVVNLSEWDDWLGGADPEAALPEVAPDSPGMLQYTSGTTGVPKGVLLRHRSLVNVAKLTLETADAEPGAVAYNPLPMFHTAACVIGTLGPLWLGGCVYLAERFDPASALDTMRREGVNLLFYVPTVLRAIIELARTQDDPPALRTVLGGAANVPRVMIEAAEQLFGASVHNLFGQTELAPVLTMTRRDDSHDDLVHTIGRPLPQVECKIIDPATGGVQPLGVAGEICARGYQQLVEYLHDPEGTARTVDVDGWVHTGDLGAMDDRGMITLTGRLKDLIIRGGENIAPAEIESCLAEHPAVIDAVAIGLPDEKWGEAVGAVIHLRGAETVGLRDELERHCRERLASFKVPQRWFLVDALPVTPTGKVRKFKLLDAVTAGELSPLK
ncbi:class I adenylate-forming enzyme family protein [Amycolatopsis echigonensis]|uniref:AMP-binding protein n=1 Tax=Amycolatopsis echigonensis TaxID=2576905 RepID=A0A8E1W7I2_9PSEU|nr:AMP-binding protein [Amycolatopsis echigonensis]MBB2504935.1 AMP-binding protein [Amycolatopsis echigonensis]